MLQLKNMRPGENIEILVKRHWVIYVLLFFYFLVGIVITFGIFFVFGFNILPSIFMIVFWMFFCIFLYIEWLNHELDMFIITNNRIIGTDQVAFLNRNVAECNLGEVQQVNSYTKGFFSNILNYGSITIQTAGNSGNIHMDFAPDSLQSARKVLNIADDYKDMKYKNFNKNMDTNPPQTSSS